MIEEKSRNIIDKTLFKGKQRLQEAGYIQTSIHNII